MKTMHTLCLTTLAGALLTAHGSAMATNLLEAYEMARGNDMAYAAAQSRWSAVQEKLPQARALLLPSAELSGNAFRNQADTQYRGATPFAGGSRKFNSNSIALSLRQPLYRKQGWVQLDQAHLQLAQGDASLAEAGQVLILRVAQAYFDVLGAEDDLSFLQAQKSAISEQLAQAKRQFEIGTATITDANEAQARFDLANAQEIAARSALQTRKKVLRQMMGAKAGTLARLADNWEMAPPQPADIDRWESLASTFNPAVVVQESAMEIAAREIERQRSGHLPTVDLVASYQADGSSGSAMLGTGSDSTTGMIGVQLNVPLYSGGAVNSRMREAQFNRDAASKEVENARRNAALDANQAYFGVTDGLGQVLALEQAVASSKSSLASSRRGWEVGVRTSIDVLDAQQQLYGARRDLAKARYATLMNMLRLNAATGQLNPDVLVETNRWLH